MKADELMDAFQYLDDDIIEAVDSIRKNPVSRKKGWPKWLATAACICLILTAIRLIPADLIGFGGGSDGTEAEDMALTNTEMEDGKEEGESQRFLTLPDYDSLIRGNAVFESSTFPEKEKDNGDTEGKDSASQLIDDSLICTADVLPVYCNLTIPTSMFQVDNLGIFEKELAKITSYDIFEQYPSITKEDAVTLLENGHYLTLAKGEYSLETDHIIELVYLYDQESDLAIPYYRFYNQTSADKKEKAYSGYFVPAVCGDYITNMPSK